MRDIASPTIFDRHCTIEFPCFRSLQPFLSYKKVLYSGDIQNTSSRYFAGETRSKLEGQVSVWSIDSKPHGDSSCAWQISISQLITVRINRNLLLDCFDILISSDFPQREKSVINKQRVQNLKIVIIWLVDTKEN